MSVFKMFSKKKTEWGCPTCTYINKTDTCAMCNTKRPPDGPIKLKFVPGEEGVTAFEMEFDRSRTIGYVKDAIAKKAKIPASKQLLWTLTNGIRTPITMPDETKIEIAVALKPGQTHVIHVDDRTKEKKKKDEPTVSPLKSLKEVESPKPAPYVENSPVIEPIAPIPPEPVPEPISGGEIVDEGEWEASGEGDEGEEWGDTKFLGQGELVAIEDKVVRPEAAATYKILSEEKVFEEQKHLLDQIDEVLGVSMSEASLLLRHYRWKHNKLLEDWCKNPEKVRKEAGLKATKKIARENLTGEFDCPFCSSTVDLSETLALGCGHRFCNDCWRGWLKAEMDKGPQAVYTNCPAFKCGEVVPDDIFLSFLSGKQRDLLKIWLMRNFMEGNESMKWCPGKNCNQVVKYDAGGQKDIDCTCGHRFCFKCGDEAHQPCPCHLSALWQQKNKSDKENTDWILANTKMCPKCKVHIEKNQGCNHMTCRHCKHEFCWLCKGDWKEHGQKTGGFYSCNTYEAKKSAGDLSAEELKSQEAQNNLNKYIFYYNRFNAHDKALAFAQKTSEKVEEKITRLLEARIVSAKSLDYLIQGVQTVIQCRRALKWSYVLGYYLKDGSKEKRIFEADQGSLEEFAEKLHGKIEKPIEELPSEKTREEIISLTNATKKYQQNLADGIMGGRYEAGLLQV